MDRSLQRLVSRGSFLRLLTGLASALSVASLPRFAFGSKPRGNENAPDRTNHDGVDAILFFGQSNAGPGGHAQSILTAPVFPRRIFTFDNGQQIYGTRLVDPSHLKGVGSLKDSPKYAPVPATALAFALGGLNTRSIQRYFVHTVWYGGQPLTSFLPGTTSWIDLLRVAQRMRQVLAKIGLDGRVTALVFIQGESGPPGRKIYARMLSNFLDQVLPSLKAQTGQESNPLAILLQTNESNVQSATAVGVPLAQWDVAGGRPQDTVLAGPMYQFPLSDAVHQSAVGRMMLGDLLALVFDIRVNRDEQFEPLHPIAARRVGNTVVVSFKRPKNSRSIQWDQTWIAPVANYGFQVRSDVGLEPIIAIEITGASEVTILLDSHAPRKRLVVSYAMGQQYAAGWAPARGQLIAPSRQRSAFVSFASVPEIVVHYAIRFEITVH